MELGWQLRPSKLSPRRFVVLRDRLDIGIAKAARMGYDGVELALAKAADVNVAQIQAAWTSMAWPYYRFDRSRLRRGACVAHEPRPVVRSRAVETLKGLIDTAAALGAGRLNTSRARFMAAGEDRDRAEERFSRPSGVARATRPRTHHHRARAGERYENNYIQSVWPDGVDVVSRLGLPNVKLIPSTCST